MSEIVISILLAVYAVLLIFSGIVERREHPLAGLYIIAGVVYGIFAVQIGILQ